MLTVPGQLKVFLCLGTTDMRKSFDSLASVVADQLKLDPLSGHLFVFRSRRGDRLKLLYWEETGYALWYKRLEAGSFRFPTAPADQKSLTISAADLAMLLDGVDLSSVRRQKRYRRSA
ncbi:MAG: IS66 family insertion sequence element accessory protein TnpB [Pirellulales bacterium]